MLPRYPIRDGAGRRPPRPISANHDPGEPSRSAARKEAIGLRRLWGRGVAKAPPAAAAAAAASSLPWAPAALGPSESGRRAGGRSCSLSAAAGGWWAPQLCSSSAPALSDMVAPGSVTSRLGSVFPFLLVLVDLQYEGESCPAPARRRRAPGGVEGRPGLPALPRRASRGGRGGSRGLRGRPGPEPAPGRGPAPGSGFVWGRGAGGGGPRDRGYGLRSRAGGLGGKRGGDFWGVLGRGDPGGLAWDPRSAPGAPGRRCWEEAVKVARREAALALEFQEVEGTVSCWMLEVSNRHPTLFWVVSRSC